MKKVLITGASRGLGLELAKIFGKNGHKLYLQGNKNALPEQYGAEHIYCNLGCQDSIAKIAVFAKEIDIFINNAAQYSNSSITETKLEDIEQILNINLRVPALLIKALWPIKTIININSLAGKAGAYKEAVYCASKHGLRGFSESLDYDATEVNCRIIDVYLGAMNTKMIDRPDREKMIDPAEAAEVIYSLCAEKKTLQVREITIKRVNY